MRSQEEKTGIVGEFLDTHESWVIDGNYSKQWFERRMEEADQIIVMSLNRFQCLARVIRRYRSYRGKTRPDMGPGCQERLDRDFIKWVLWSGRSKENRTRLRRVTEQYPKKTVNLKTQKQIDAFEQKTGLTGKARKR